MNLLEMLATELKDKHFNDFEKLRYIYIRTCQIFSYNYEYYYCNLLSNSNQRKELIKNEEPNITNIKTNLITCKSYSVYILEKLLQELVNNIKVKSTSCGDKSHYYLIVHTDTNDYVLDSVLYDLTRVKMNLSTKGFITVNNSSIQTNPDFLKEIDLKIGYIKNDYENNNINNYISEIINMPINNAFCNISQKIKSYSMIKEYSDTTNMIDLLTTPIMDHLYSETYINDDMVVKLYLLKENNNNYFYVLKDKDNKFTLENSNKKEFMNYVKKLKSQRYQITKYI